MSSRLRLINQTQTPNSKQIIEACCLKCGAIKKAIFSEHIRAVNRQAAYTSEYHCSKCLKALPSYIRACSIRSKLVVDKIKLGSSERSKKLWTNPEYKAKMRSAADKLKGNQQFSETVSKSIKSKFANDKEYVSKVNASRKNLPAEFLSRCSDIHDGYYDYSNSSYLSLNVELEIRCPEHGPFKQLPSNHVRGHGCPKCAIDRSKTSHSEYFDRCSSIHSGKYDYTNSLYTSSTDYITYICPIHGRITQLAQNHLRGNGCKYCDQQKTSSKGEDELAEFITSIASCRRNSRDILDNSEIDIMTGNIGFEYHGLYWHSYNRIETKNERFRHFNKLDAALSKGIELIQIYEDEWLNKKDIVKSMIKSKLCVIDNKIYARRCRVVKIDEIKASDFFNLNHLNGHRKAKIYLGLEIQGAIVSAASYSYTGKYWELIRYCNAIDLTVVGGLSRLVKHSGLSNIFTYADRRYSPKAKSYINCGFKMLGITQPGYKYCKGLKTYSRQSFQKHKQAKLLAMFNESNTEAQNMFNNGFRRIWDAGHYKLGL